ncbi:hypothetical protein AJ78_07453 [Emergomyces pasteurianus Ep9510]|uniref:Glycosyl hydrolase family 32 N-terminal domain-containing protein n=1 Tax=Emergomyces pasteurianus Ep9510 TaxID=1447872 RepID=A0A1J9P7J1_9EURO|nr:hypothetical protein AJ78_07453 [Emergomyces pasteurianus Ep9510]
MGSISTVNSLNGRTFFRLRPSFHFLAPGGWMNDPCAPGYDSHSRKYHLFYQWNPHDCDWGNISWGHAVSDNLITWSYTAMEPLLKPDAFYDKKGIFTGCFHPTGIHGEPDQLTVFYTSVCHLPVHWSISNMRGAEGLSVATSKNGGSTWEKLIDNPILKEEPDGFDVTGFRDPALAEWPEMDELRGEKALYGLISGGIQGAGPNVFLYAIDPTDLRRWRYLGTLFESIKNSKISRRWSGDYGLNFECSNFMALQSGSVSRDFLITGTEGGTQRDWIKYSPGSPERTVRWCVWLSGSLTKQDDEIKLNSQFGGILDHGVFYAANSFYDPVTEQRILWGWIPEEDVTLDYCRAKGWNGSLALPREVFLLVIPNVTRALATPLSEITSVAQHRESDGSLSLHTLGIRPLAALNSLRRKSLASLHNISLPSALSTIHSTAIRSTQWELSATISITSACEQVGFHLRHNPGFSTKTTVSFVPPTEDIIVDRSQSNPSTKINKFYERGPFTLFTQRINGQDVQEQLKLRIFCDNDVLEVYANDRFALTTMIYTDDEEAVELSLFADGKAGAAVFDNVTIWEMGGIGLSAQV